MSWRLLSAFAVATSIVVGCAASPAAPTPSPAAATASPTAAATANPTAAPTSGSTASASASASAAPSASLATIGIPADNGARIVNVETLGPRTRDLTIESPSVGTVKTRLLLPARFDQQKDRKFPTLYLLHGAGGGYTDWTLNTDVEKYTAAEDVIVAMPDGASSGIAGWYTDWETPGALGKQAWETLDLTELPQLLERNFQANDQRAVGGNSMGGYGSIIYAARHPGFYKSAASYSGALDLRSEVAAFPDANDNARWGDPVKDASNWDTHDPLKMLPNLKGTDLYVSFGNGDPGPLDQPGRDKDKLETVIGKGNVAFTDAMKAAAIPANIDAYGPGTHSWPYWDRELKASLPQMLKAIGAG